jgi:hypothetical protein
MIKTTKKALAMAVVFILIKWILIIGLGTYLYKVDFINEKFFMVLPVIGISIFVVRLRKRKKRQNVSY